jgi:hypothetical protein
MIVKALITMCIALASFTSSAEAFSEWEPEDKKLLIATEVLLLADWAQTRQTAKNPDKYQENNVVLGKHPSVGRVNTYFAASMLGTYLIAKHYPEHRTVFLGGLLVLEGITVYSNKMIGLNFAF